MILFISKSFESFDMTIDLFTFKTRGLDGAPKSGKFVKENKSITPVLATMMLPVAGNVFVFQNTYQRVNQS